MNEIKLKKDINIAFDGVNISKLKKGDVLEVTDFELSRLSVYDAIEIKEKPKKEKPSKSLEIETKEKPKK